MSQQFLLAFPNLITETTPTLSGGDYRTTAPRSNLLTWPLAEVARTTDAAVDSTKISIDWGSAKTARALIIPRHNVSSAGTIRWKRGTSAGGTQVADSGTINAWRFTPRSYDGAVYDLQVLLSASSSARYETIEIVDTTNAAGYIDFGRLFIAPVFAATWNPDYGLRDGHNELSKVGRAFGGAQWPNQNRRPRSVSFALNFLSLSEGDTLHEMEQIEGTTAEVGYLPYSDDAARMQRFGMLGMLRDLSGIEYPRTLNRGRGFAIEQRV